MVSIVNEEVLIREKSIILEIETLARAGLKDNQILNVLGIPRKTLERFKKKHLRGDG